MVVQSRGTRLQDSTETPNKLLYFFRRKESCLCLIIISNNQLDGTDRDRSFRENQTKCSTSMHPNCMCYLKIFTEQNILELYSKNLK